MQGSARPIHCWSALVQPCQQWLEGGLWSPESAAVHGIEPEILLEQGRPPEQICDRLNALLAPASVVVTDAPLHDQDWLDSLLRAAGREQLFTLREFDALTGSLDAGQGRRLAHLLDRSPIPHRAGADALRLASALMEAAVGHPPEVRWLNP